jgi:hypothetical protein
VKGKRIKKTNVHLQNANEIGGTNSTPPLATTKFDAIKIGCINKSEKAKRLLFFLLNGLLLDYLFFIKERFINHHKNCNTH